MVYCYFKLKDKSFTAQKIHLWRYNDDDLSDITDLDKKWKDYTSVKIDGFLLNQSQEQKNKELRDVDLAEEDTIIVEIPKKSGGSENFVFVPLQGKGEEDIVEQDKTPAVPIYSGEINL